MNTLDGQINFKCQTWVTQKVIIESWQLQKCLINNNLFLSNCFCGSGTKNASPNILNRKAY